MHTSSLLFVHFDTGREDFIFVPFPDNNPPTGLEQMKQVSKFCKRFFKQEGKVCAIRGGSSCRRSLAAAAWQEIPLDFLIAVVVSQKGKRHPATSSDTSKIAVIVYGSGNGLGQRPKRQGDVDELGDDVDDFVLPKEISAPSMSASSELLNASDAVLHPDSETRELLVVLETDLRLFFCFPLSLLHGAEEERCQV